ncbi:MAG: hypothetical protein K2N35_16090 [Muribaculaceae bacterium]|nr:hypothetical protein [Muribaculaceae bacterium]
MKKILLSAILAVISIGVHAEYNRLVFRTLSGEEQSIGVKDLSIKYENGDMIAVSGSESVKIPLTSLKSMEFSDINAVGEVSAVDNSEVTAFSVNGICLGKFETKSDALNGLPTGIYILNSKNGVTFKVSISK